MEDKLPVRQSLGMSVHSCPFSFVQWFRTLFFNQKLFQSVLHVLSNVGNSKIQELSLPQ